MSEPILVLGMHRSGTSSVAGVLAKLGGRAPRSLMPPAPQNARGFFESTQVMVLNDELLASGGSSWDDWRRFNPSWFASAEAAAFRGRARDLFEAEFGGSSIPVLKDPRICRLAPFWLDLFKELGAKPRIVVPVRSPLEVAQSLRDAHAMPLSKGLLLWLRHVLDAEAFSRNEKRSIFTWDQFLADWRGAVETIGAEAAIAWPRLSDRAGREIENFLGRELVHQRVAPAELAGHSKVHEWTLSAYEALLELARNPFSNSAIEKLNEIKDLFDRACALFGPVLADEEIATEELEARLAALCGDQDKLAAEAAERQGALEAAGAENARLAEELQRASAAREEATARAAELAGRLEPALAALAEAQGERERLGAALAEAQAETGRLSHELGQVGEARNKLAAELAQAARETEELSLSFTTVKDGLLVELREKQARLLVAMTELSAARVDLSAAKVTEQAFAAERERLAATANAAEEARRNAEKEAAARFGEHEATSAAALAASEKHAEAQIHALTDRLVEAEARLAKARRPPNGAVWKRLLPGRRHGEARLLLKSGLFDDGWYKSQYPDAAANGRSPVEHFLEEGYLSGCKPNPIFDPRWYLDRYGDVRHSGMNPLIHYLKHGWREGRDPGPGFHADYYLESNPDVRAKRLNPLIHYLLHGRHEGRLPVRPR